MKVYFSTSGIRGKVGTEITPFLAYLIGVGASHQLVKNNEAFTGRDNRRSSQAIESGVVMGLLENGIHTVSSDRVLPTPAVVNYTNQSVATLGVMVTGSHLPASDTGILLFDEEGDYFRGNLLIPDDALHPTRETITSSFGSWEHYEKQEITSEPHESYLHKIRDYQAKLDDTKKLHVLLDPAHGPATPYLLEAVQPFATTVSLLNSTNDDTFPGRPSEPHPKNLGKTIRLHQEIHADLGVATDMDGDRVVFIADNGRIALGDHIGTLFAIDYWEQHPGAPVIAPVNTSLILNKMAQDYNGKVVYSKIGPPSIIKMMHHENATFGFEETGKFFFKDLGLWPDAILTTLKLIEFLQARQTTLSDLLSLLPKTVLIKEKIPFPRVKAQRLMQLIRDDLFASNKFEAILTIDGYRAELDTHEWVMIRPSGTENYVRIFAEGFTGKTTEDLLNYGKSLVNKYKEKILHDN